MPIILGIDERTPDVWREPTVVLYPEVIQYLDGLTQARYGKRFRQVAELSRLDPYGTASIPLRAVPAILQEATELQKMTSDRELAIPPRFMGSEELGEPGELFDWPGLMNLWRSLSRLCEVAIKEDRDLIAVGD